VPSSDPPTDVVMIGEVAESTFPASVADGKVVRKYVDTEGRQVIKGYDNSADAIRIVDPAPALTAKTGPISFAQLTAVGTTVATNVRPFSVVSFQVTVAALAALETCVVRIEESQDNSVWANMNDTGLDTTIGLNGTYVFSKSGVATEYVRFNFVGDSATAAVTLDVKLMAGN
jgi:hypothetical protein